MITKNCMVMKEAPLSTRNDLNVEQLELSPTASGNVKWYDHPSDSSYLSRGYASTLGEHTYPCALENVDKIVYVNIGNSKTRKQPRSPSRAECTNRLQHVYTVDYLPATKMNELQPQPRPGRLTNKAERKEQDPAERMRYDSSQMTFKTRQNTALLFGDAQSDGKTEEKKQITQVRETRPLGGGEKGHTGRRSAGMFCFLTWVLVHR